LYRDGRPDYKRIADLIKLSKTDLSKISQVAKSSVRFDANIPELSPRDMIRIGRYKRLLNFVLEAREAEAATPR
jgi:hypothetical protein